MTVRRRYTNWPRNLEKGGEIRGWGERDIYMRPTGSSGDQRKIIGVSRVSALRGVINLAEQYIKYTRRHLNPNILPSTAVNTSYLVQFPFSVPAYLL